MATNCILQVPLQNSPDAVLVNVEHDQVGVKLRGTEGENGYLKKMKGNLLDACKSKKYEGKPEEQEAVLSWGLLQRSTDPKFERLVRRLEITAVLEPSKTIELFFRIRDGEYTQLFGVIELHHDPDLEIELFDWTADAARSTQNTLNRCSELSARLEAKDSELASLRRQLEDLTAAKASHEGELLEKFRLLLNSKKLKIRDQQRLLTEGGTATNGPAIARARREGNATPHREKAKRKAIDEFDGESSDGFDAVKKEPKDANTDDEMETMLTPAASEPDTEDEDLSSKPPNTDAKQVKPSQGSDPMNGVRMDGVTEKEEQPRHLDDVADDETDDEL